MHALVVTGPDAGYEIVICIPAHGPSRALRDTVARLSEVFAQDTERALLAIANSGAPIGDLKWPGPLKLISVPPDVYWTGAVKALFSFVEDTQSKYVLLLNHDCIPAPDAIGILQETADRVGNGAICHAVVLRKDNECIAWWAGNVRQRWHLSYSRKYYNMDARLVPAEPYPTLSTMGQCLLLPHAAARARFLDERRMPHYWGDSAMSSEMRRAGYRLLMVPRAIAYTDQSDYAKKRAKITCRKVSDIKRVFFEKSSNRYLPGAFWGMAAQHDSRVLGIAAGAVYAIGKVAKALGEWVLGQDNQAAEREP